MKKIKVKASSRILKKRNKKLNSNILKRCRFCSDKDLKNSINYKNASLLKGFLTDCGKILSSKVSGNCYACQKKLSSEIKISRIMALIPFCSH
jgi:small subunit ribosomal protein S18